MKSFFHKRSSRGLPAFTIIELLVALTITAAITTMMITIVVNVLNSWSRSSATLTAGNQARVILDQLSADLQGAVLRASPDVMFAATISKNQVGTGDAVVGTAKWTPTGSEDMKPGNSASPNGSLYLGDGASRDLQDYRFGQAGVWLRLFTVPPDNSSTGASDLSAPRAVSYQLIRKRVGSASAPDNYQLFRSEVRPFGNNATTIDQSTFANGYDFFAANGYNNPTLSSGGTSQSAAGMIRRPSAPFLLGNGVIDFGVRIFTRSTTGALEEAFPVDRRGGGATVRRVFAASTDTTKLQPNAAFATANDYTTAQTSYGYPAVVEVMVRILTPDGVEIIQAYEDNPTRFGGATASKWWELAEANSKVFTRRIEVRSKPL